MQIDKECLPGGYKDVKPGDCVVAFSRNDIYDIKATIESATGHKCASTAPHRALLSVRRFSCKRRSLLAASCWLQEGCSSSARPERLLAQVWLT